MKADFDEHQWKRDAKNVMANGVLERNPEQPKRIYGRRCGHRRP